MKFVKENLVLVICGAVALLALVAWFWPIGAWRNAWVEEKSQDYNQRQSSIKQNMTKSLEIPGSDIKSVGIPTEQWITAKEQVSKEMTKEADQVIKLSAEANMKQRVVKKGNVLVPLLDGKPEPGYLPKVAAGSDPMLYKEDYQAVADAWRTKMVGNTGPSTPPQQAQIAEDLRLAKEKQALGRPAGMQAPAGIAGSEARELQNAERQALIKRASGIHMYLDDNAILPRGNWVNSPNPPLDVEIFESLMDSWYKSDVVRAIQAVNDAELAKAKPEDKNVSTSPIKRLMAIRVGNDARGVRLGTFGTQGSSGQSATGSNSSLWVMPQLAVVEDVAVEGDSVVTDIDSAAPPPPPPVTQENTIDYLRSMTGRACGKDYDVTMLQVCMDIDPAYLNRFINELYRQNMGYTLVNMRWRVVDPLDRATNGFIYGKTQVIEVDMLFEGLLFRNWTLPLMPTSVRNQLQIAPDTVAPPQ